MLNSKIGRTFLVILALLLCLGAVGGILALSHRDTVEVKASAFKIGGLDAGGAYTARKDAIYTPEAFSCQGLKVTPAFDSNVEYQIFFFDEDDRFLEATEVMTGAYTEERLLPSYARIMIIADDTDADGDVIEDFKLRSWDVRKVAGNLDITVDANQEKQYSNNLFELGEVEGISEYIEIDEYDSVLLHLVDTSLTNTTYTITFYSEKTTSAGTTEMRKIDDSTITMQNYNEGDFMWYEIEDIPGGTTHMTITYTDDNTNIGVYGVK